MSLPVFCVSLPKCGTHLLRSCLLRLGLDHAAFEVSAERELAVQATYRAHQASEATRWFWGNAPPVVAPDVVEGGFTALLTALGHLLPGSFLHGHYAYEPRLAAALRERGIPVIVIARDPRAALLSMANYVLRRREPRELAHRLPTEPSALYDALVAGNEVVHSLQENFDAYRGWLDDPATLLVRFEDLVGPKGGGSLGRQAATITRIIEHVGLTPGPMLVARALHGTFDTASPTFFQGHSERWRSALPPSVLAQIEERASSALATWGAPTLTAEYDQRMTAATLADWAAALADDSATSDARVVALRDENARKQQIIDEWVERAFELQATAWKHATAEQGLSAALADSEARLALIHKQQATIADLTEQRDRYLHESDDRLAIIRRIETLLQQAIAERDRYAAESAERLALIRREQARLAALRPR